MEERYRLFDTVLKTLHNEGALAGLILIGSWCQYVYRAVYNNTAEIPALITSDIDFLVPNPSQISTEVDVPGILEKLDFEMVASTTGNMIKCTRRELEVEFLTPETGRGMDGSRVIKSLRVRAQGLRYLSMLQEHAELVYYKGIPVRTARVEAYVLHKFLVGDRRQKQEKNEKDFSAAVQLGEFLINRDNGIEKMKSILELIHPRWGKDILASVKKHSIMLYTALIR